ncbi:MAG: hypothetical protein SP1CHLAM54_17510 [Chlamydiia bacterium]|nr:hypothetical protein [Chlamydiia bacterium]MCH9616639.1 hypothetical protein [Chlamydiia bacterium]MCH9629370.1 hypothetical protein [Chlamydiia bacterium]
MAGFFIVEEGPLSGLTIRFETGDEWLIGRDPESVFQALEDPMVSRKHVMVRLTDEGFICENLSAVNPAQLNGKPIAEPVLLGEGDLVQIGEVVMRFTHDDPQGALQTDDEFEDEEALSSTPTIYDEDEELDQFTLLSQDPSRWVVKAISGPNSGGEFNLEAGKTYVIGKDAGTTDITFQDLSVSRQHARISLGEDGVITVEDLGSRNGVLVNGHKLMEPKALKSQDVIALGTTTLLLIDRDEERETIYSPPSNFGVVPEKESDEVEGKKSWKDTIIPMRHIVIGCVFLILVLVAIGGVFSLFKSSAIEIVKVDESKQIQDVLDKFPSVNFNLTKSTGKVFLIGHVMTEIEHQELMYMIKTLPFIRSVDDNVIIDELVWENFNALLMKNPKWRSVSVSSISPGKFILRGFVASNDEAIKLDDYITVNFPFLEHLNNDVIVEKTLEDEVQTYLLERGFVNVTFQLAGGEVILAGRVSKKDERKFNDMIATLSKAKGVRTVKSFVIFVNASSAVMDLSGKYKVTGTSKFGNIDQYVVVNGKILSRGDTLDGMMITKIMQNTVYLEKDGLKFRINYNQQ